jgi:O-antigen/teichoic acid export membrane protein
MISESSKRRPTREQQVRSISLTIGLGGGLLGALGALAAVFGEALDSEFFRGVGAGVLAALPLFFAVLTVQGVRRMDEYARQLQARAASLAFLVTMLSAGTLISLEAVLGFSTPAWVFYVVGMLAWALAAAVLSARDQREA